MTFEDRVRDAMHARVEGVDAPTMAARAEGPRHVWPAVTVGFAIVVVFALVVALVASGSSDDSTPPASTSYPSRIVVVTYDGRLQVRSAKDGHLIRTLAEDADPEGGVAVDPKGRTIYYTRFVGDSACGAPEQPLREIASVAVRGGQPVSMVFGVRSPAVSPDGRYLAFTGVPNCSDAGSAIVVRDLMSSSNQQRTWFADQPTRLGLTGLSWSPDGRHLLFVWRDAPGGSHPRILDTDTTDTPVEAAPSVPIGDDSAVCCYLGATGALAGNRLVVRPDGERLEPSRIDVVSGEAVKLTCCGSVIASSRTGRALLVHLGAGDLGRWTTGSAHPVRIASGITTAVWLPGS